MIIAIAVVSWAQTVRVVRSKTQVVKSLPFVEAASPWKVRVQPPWVGISGRAGSSVEDIKLGWYQDRRNGAALSVS